MAVTFDGTAVPREVVDAMTAAAAHRAVDGSRTWSGPGAGAGYLRLAVTAEDRRDLQPLAAGTLVCVADARIDNRQELGDALGLPAAGHGGATECELLLAAYRAWGTDCAARVFGDFAFVVWDTAARTLFAGRDPVGARSLFYRNEPGRRALVATEVAQVLAAPGVPDRPDEQSVLADVAGLFALPHRSHHEGVRQLPPGQALLLGQDVERTWSFRKLGRGPRVRYRREQEYAEHFRALLDEAVRARLRTDRPAGVLLSGGLDSMAVAALGSRHAGVDGGAPSLTGFSWAFDELAEADERHVSGPLAAELGIPVHDVPVDDAWPLSSWPERAPSRDDPYIWLYQDAFDRSCDRAREAGVRVLLTADRGDEVSGGWVYDELGLLASGQLRRLAEDHRAYRANPGRTSHGFLTERLLRPLATTAWPPGAADPLRQRLPGAARTKQKPLAPWVPEAAARRLGLDDVMTQALPVPPVRGHARRQRVMAVSDVIGLRVLQLRQRTFASAGLQHADPWGDERLLNYVCALPQHRVQRQGLPKELARQAMRGVLPERVRTSPAHSNQYPLYQRAFAEREVATVRGLLRDSRADAAGLLDAGAVLDTYESYLRGEPLQHDFWYPLTVELWLRRWWG